MIPHDTRHAILTLHRQQTPLREISRLLQISRGTVRRVIRQPDPRSRQKEARDEDLLALIEPLFPRCRGNVVRLQELLRDEYHIEVPYSTLTRLVRQAGLRTPKRRAGAYHFEPGQEMQHDTSPHHVILGGKSIIAQCAALVLAYSRRLFIQYYPRFTRFEAKWFLTEAVGFMDGACPTCTIDNTSVLVASGSGPDAQIAPEMVAFGKVFGLTFRPHAVGHADRKARVERPFAYVEGNFLAGRTFQDWPDLNAQARAWCQQVANAKPKRALGMSPEVAYVMEKPALIPMPPYIPPVYQSSFRVVDVEAYVTLDTNRYSVPERLIAQTVEVLKYPDRVRVVYQHHQVADHPRLIGRRDGKITAPGHHQPLAKQRAYGGPAAEEQHLMGHTERLDRYVGELKQRAAGRGVARLRRLLHLKRTYPTDAFDAAIEQALHYGLYDLGRLEGLILERVAGDFFQLGDLE
jgi:transposase